jgi:hypothetical protein
MVTPVKKNQPWLANYPQPADPLLLMQVQCCWAHILGVTVSGSYAVLLLFSWYTLYHAGWGS